MREYLESSVLQSIVAEFFARNLLIGAICHGVLLAARSSRSDGRSVVYGKKTTALTKLMELTNGVDAHPREHQREIVGNPGRRGFGIFPLWRVKMPMSRAVVAALKAIS